MAIGLVAWTTYRSWRAGPWDIPGPMAQRPTAIATEQQVSLTPRPPIGTEAIVTKNLFDPERGAGASRDAEENSRAVQRVRGMILVGTVIIGNNRVAILQDSASPAPGQPIAGDTKGCRSCERGALSVGWSPGKPAGGEGETRRRSLPLLSGKVQNY